MHSALAVGLERNRSPQSRRGVLWQDESSAAAEEQRFGFGCSVGAVRGVSLNPVSPILDGARPGAHDFEIHASKLAHRKFETSNKLCLKCLEIVLKFYKFFKKLSRKFQKQLFQSLSDGSTLFLTVIQEPGKLKNGAQKPFQPHEPMLGNGGNEI